MPFGSDAFNRTRVGRADVDGDRAIGAASTTGTKAGGALFVITVNAFSACRPWRSLTQLRNWLALIPCASASPATDTPGPTAASIKRSFSAGSNRRFPLR